MSDDLTIAYQLGVEDMRSKLHKQADEIERLRLELDMQQATILVPSQKDDQRRIERLDAALKEALDEAAQLRSRIDSAEQAYVRLDASMNRLKAAFRVNMLRAFPHMSHDEIDAEIAAALGETDELLS